MQTPSLKVDLGCGREKRPGYFGVDIVDGPGVDLVCDLNDPLPFSDNSVCEAHCKSVLEHLSDPIAFLDDLHRVLVPNGLFHVYVPHFSNPFGHSDPTHLHLFGLYSFQYFARSAEQQYVRKVPDHYTTRHWQILEQRLVFSGRTPVGRLSARGFGRVINSSLRGQEFYERALSWLRPCYTVSATLSPEKSG